MIILVINRVYSLLNIVVYFIQYYGILLWPCPSSTQVLYLYMTQKPNNNIQKDLRYIFNFIKNLNMSSKKVDMMK